MKLKRTLSLLVLISILALSLFVLSGCDLHYTKKAGEYSCVDCHTNEELLLADLELAPPPAEAESESEGEG